MVLLDLLGLIILLYGVSAQLLNAAENMPSQTSRRENQYHTAVFLMSVHVHLPHVVAGRICSAGSRLDPQGLGVSATKPGLSPSVPACKVLTLS